MKKLITVIISVILLVSLNACNKVDVETKHDERKKSETTTITENTVESITIKSSPDKYTWYVKNYVGKNCAMIGYTSMGGDRMDHYGAGYLELVFVNADGKYIDISSEEKLKDWVVIEQDIEPNAELKFTFQKDSEGKEYSNLIESQSYEEIVLTVKKVGTTENKMKSFTKINASPDKYTYYIRDYVGRNLTSCGYTSMGGDLRAAYGGANIKFAIVADNGEYIDPTDGDVLKNYVVTSQNIQPNTKLELVYMKDSEGKEYSNLVETQNIEEIELYVKKIS